MNRVLGAGRSYRNFMYAILVGGCFFTVQGAFAQTKDEPHIAFQYGADYRFGVSILRDPSGKQVDKQLTFSSTGGTNDAMVRIDGKDVVFPSKGKWISTDKKTKEGSSSIWSYGKLRVEQILQVRKGKDGLLDTLLVRYVLHNTDTKALKAGFRMQMDSLIGRNDGVPFTYAGSTDLIKTYKEFKGAQVPEWVEALENHSNTDPGTVAHMTLKWGNGNEAPDQVAITAWPGPDFSTWEVPLKSMEKSRDKDSCIVLYWNEKSIPPGGKRNFAFAYGTLAEPTVDEKAIDDIIVKRVKDKGGKSGNPWITLKWDNPNDLDLHVIDPNGERVYWNHKSSKAGAALDVDMNVRYDPKSTTPIENIFWPVGKAPKGRYKIIVDHYRNHGKADCPDPTRFTVRLSVGGMTRLFHGEVVRDDPKRKQVVVHEFDVK